MPDTPQPLTTRQTAALLRSMAQVLRSEAEALGGDGLRRHPAPGEWCVNEVLGHIIEAERRGFTGRIQQIVAQAGRKLETWDQVRVAHDRADCDRDGMDLVREFEAMREESIRLVSSLTADQLQLSGDHPNVGILHISELLHEWVHHDREHLKQFLSNVQAYVWPHMGNAQRFS